MKAIILCAGEGERLRPITDSIPKPLILILDKPILYYIFSSLPKEIDELFIVIQKKHKKLFKDFLSKNKLKIKVNFLIQDILKKPGTYYALFTAYKFLKNENKFLVLNGDDIFLKKDLEKLILSNVPCYGLSYKKLDKRYRTCNLDKKNKTIISFRKQKEDEIGKKIVCFSGAFTLNKDFFSYNPVFIGSEAGIPHTLFSLDKKVHYVLLKEWIQINTLEDLAFAQKFFK